MIFPVSRFTRKAKGVIRKTGSESFRPFRNHAFILWQSTHHFNWPSRSGSSRPIRMSPAIRPMT
jgi:hypothetical protein